VNFNMALFSTADHHARAPDMAFPREIDALKRVLALAARQIRFSAARVIDAMRRQIIACRAK